MFVQMVHHPCLFSALLHVPYDGFRFDTSLAEASREVERVLHVLENCLPFRRLPLLERKLL